MASTHDSTKSIEPIAIVGMGCRFPGGVTTPAEFWRLLESGTDAIGEVPADRWDISAWFDPDPAAPGKMNSKWGGFLKSVDHFDADFFGIAPREADLMDPQQRLLLEVTWEALENAGIAPTSLGGSTTGVFMGVSSTNYAGLLHHDPQAIGALTNSGGSACIAANRISYFLDLRGPSLAIDAACSSSLAAVHLACQSLLTGECETVIAGGVNIILAPSPSVSLSKARVLSPDGRCRVFDAGANGFVRGEGAGVIVLKLLSRALADGDPISAVIRGTALHQGGRTNGLMAPSRWAQEAVVRDACRRAGVSPAALQYVESHSAASAIGDAMELNALGTVLGPQRDPQNKCAVGSVKTNIGHLEGAAGIAGLIKVALMLRHQKLAQSLHFQKPNPHVPFESLPLRVQRELQPWTREDGPRIAGVSGSGFGGVNAHIVLQEAEENLSPLESSIGLHLLTLSARSATALKELAARFSARLDAEPGIELGDLCFTTNIGRTHFNHRVAIVGKTAAEMRNGLAAYVADETKPGLYSGVAKRTASSAASIAAAPLASGPGRITSRPSEPASAESDGDGILHELARRYTQGLAIDWAAAGRGRKLNSLPTYPFQRQRHWVADNDYYTRPSESSRTPDASPEPQAVTADSREIVPPRTDVEKALVQIWREILGTRQIGITDNFFELGGGSIMAIELFTRIEQVLGAAPSPAILFQKPTIAELAGVIAAAAPATPAEKLLSPIRLTGDLPPIFLLTPGHLFQFTALARRLTPGHPIYVGAFPERFSTPGITIPEIAAAYRAEIERICPTGDYHLFGFCAGGIVCYQIAQQLAAIGRAPASLGMVDAPCPPPGFAPRLGRYGYFASRIGANLSRLYQLPLRDALGHIISRGKFLPMVLRLPGFRSARPEQLVTVAHREAVQRYQPAAYEGAVDLYLAEEPWPSAEEDSRFLWRELARNGHTHRFSGVHDELLKSPRVFEIADRLNEALAGTRVVAPPVGEPLERAPRPAALSMATGTRS